MFFYLVKPLKNPHLKPLKTPHHINVENLKKKPPIVGFVDKKVNPILWLLNRKIK